MLSHSQPSLYNFFLCNLELPLHFYGDYLLFLIISHFIVRLSHTHTHTHTHTLLLRCLVTSLVYCQLLKYTYFTSEEPSHFTCILSNTQSLYFCGAHTNGYLDLGIWGGGWAGLVTSLADCQIHYLCTRRWPLLFLTFFICVLVLACPITYPSLLPVGNPTWVNKTWTLTR